jgi:hypothetical protein
VSWPEVLGERETITQAASGKSLSRFGDGELKLALGHDNISQKASPALSAELRAILKGAGEQDRCVVAIPNIRRNVKGEAWERYGTEKYQALLGSGPYASAFVTRPDSAPWIDTEEYWAAVRALWTGRDVIFVRGGGKATERSLRVSDFANAGSVVTIEASTHRDAYEEIDQLQAAIEAQAAMLERPLVILCLGAAATCLAWRLAPKLHALDLGHIGMFMRSAGSYRFAIDELASHVYRQQLRAMHEKTWGADGIKHLDEVLRYADKLGADTILDYGCGEAKLSEAAKAHRRILNYDPGVIGRDGLPKPCDMVVCTDVLEHVEPERLDNVLAHIRHLTQIGAFLVIATRPANARLPDGRNAHLTVRDEDWWLQKIAAQGWTVDRTQIKPGRDITLWLRK